MGYLIEERINIFFAKVAFQGLNRTLAFKNNFSFIFLSDCPSKVMKNAFYFILKALFVLKTFKCLF